MLRSLEGLERHREILAAIQDAFVKGKMPPIDAAIAESAEHARFQAERQNRKEENELRRKIK